MPPRAAFWPDCACAQCHDHKYDPIPTKDYYSLLGIFTDTKLYEFPLAPKAEVEAYKARKKQIDERRAANRRFHEEPKRGAGGNAGGQYRRLHARRSGRSAGPPSWMNETLERWKKYLKHNRTRSIRS